LGAARLPDADARHVLEVDLVESDAAILGGAHDVDGRRDQAERDGA
jgi:hypothetical protein